MNLNDYNLEIDTSIALGAEAPKKLSELLTQCTCDEDLTSEQRLDIESRINDLRDKLIPNIGSNLDTTAQNKPSRFPTYRFIATAERPNGITALNPDGLDYAVWFRDVYLPTFHPMPSPEIQYPMVTVFSLINSKAVPNDYTTLPIPNFLGMQGSGKTQLATQIRKHYHPEFSIEIRPNFTGAAIRDELDKRFSCGEPGLAVFDNFNPDLSLARIGTHYDIVLANNKKSSISKISNRGNEELQHEYNTYCFKMLTSIFDLESAKSPECLEIARRCITLIFKEAEPLDSLEAYNWDTMQLEYAKLWGASSLKKITEVYSKAMYDLNTLKPKSVPIKGSRWDMCKVPIAVGVYAGVFRNIQHGINHFQDYFDWYPTAKNSSQKDLLALAVRRFVDVIFPKFLEEDKLIAEFRVPKYNPNIIDYADIKKYIESLKYKLQRRDDETINQILSSYGYILEISGQQVIYRKDIY